VAFSTRLKDIGDMGGLLMGAVNGCLVCFSLLCHGIVVSLSHAVCQVNCLVGSGVGVNVGRYVRAYQM